MVKKFEEIRPPVTISAAYLGRIISRIFCREAYACGRHDKQRLGLADGIGSSKSFGFEDIQ
ncbi:hypothetical protein Tdes44962_MAKER04273 [Teratosphaeria destructans]|uniref:Uncharacterized protein n=1 Tax=Teratosphaeria destructans TaxID=418781 RepID=A0A9W7SMM9_9PEZI|nr:hypothetical protein Tdes44962_MAKER04273 [Teratosphaeria destructans]